MRFYCNLRNYRVLYAANCIQHIREQDHTQVYSLTILLSFVLGSGRSLYEKYRRKFNKTQERDEKMNKKKNVLIAAAALALVGFAGCSEASRVETNLTKEADNFNIVRQLTVINCLQGDVLFQMTGKMAITADVSDNQLEIIVENEDGSYTKHFVGLSDNVTYTVEDLNLGANDVEKYKYTLNFNPNMWFPYEIETID